MTRIATTARTMSCTDQRKTSTNLHNIDHAATNISLKTLPPDEQGMIKMSEQGATWDKNHTTKSGYSNDTGCDHCGMMNADFAHVTWRCPALDEARQNCINKFCPGLTADMLHPAMLYGIAPAMSPLHDRTFWGSIPNPDNEAINKVLGV